MKKYTLRELKSLPTLCVGQIDDLKIETSTRRVWLCRCGVDDGMPYDNMVTVETFRDGRWIECDTYPAA